MGIIFFLSISEYLQLNLCFDIYFKDYPNYPNSGGSYNNNSRQNNPNFSNNNANNNEISSYNRSYSVSNPYSHPNHHHPHQNPNNPNPAYQHQISAPGGPVNQNGFNDNYNNGTNSGMYNRPGVPPTNYPVNNQMNQRYPNNNNMNANQNNKYGKREEFGNGGGGPGATSNQKGSPNSNNQNMNSRGINNQQSFNDFSSIYTGILLKK